MTISKIIPLPRARQQAATAFRFTQASVRTAIGKLPPEGEATLKDETLKGLVLRRRASTWAWYLRKRVDGKFLSVSIAEYDPNGRIDDIRAKAQQFIAEARTGRTPTMTKERTNAKQASGLGRMTLRELLADYLVTNQPRKTTAAAYQYAVNKFEPHLPKHLGDLDAAAFRAAFLHLRDNGALRAATLNSYAKAIRALVEFWVYLHPEAKRDAISNPVRSGMQTGKNRTLWTKPQPRDGRLNADERRRWLMALHGHAENTHPVARVSHHALEALFLTGMRVSEIGGLRWSEVGENAITIPAERFKSKRPFVKPITGRLRQILDVRRAMADSTDLYVFASWKSGADNHKPIDDLRKTLATVNEAAGVEIVPHDLRRTYVAVASVLMGELPVKLLVGHSTEGDVTAGYAGSLAEALPKLAQTVEDELIKGVR